MKKVFLSDDAKLSLIEVILSLFILSNVLTTPFFLKVSLYVLTLIGLISLTGFKNAIKNNFLNYYPYFLFILICFFSYVFIPNDISKFSESPQIENIISLFCLFVFLIAWNPNYFKVMKILVLVTSVFLIISLPVHFFYYESSLLSASAFFSHLDLENLSNKNTFGVFLSILLPFSLYELSKKMSIYNYLKVMLFCVSIFYIFSRAALILSTFATLLMLISGRKDFFKASSISILSVLVLLSFFQVSPTKYNELKAVSNMQINSENYKDITQEEENINYNTSKTFTSEGARFTYIKLSYQGFLKKPLLGHGLTTFRKNHNILDEKGELKRKPVTHNDYAQILYELGLLGLLSFLYLFVFNFMRLYKNTSLKSNESIIILIQLLTLAVSLNSGNYLDHALFWIVMGLTLSKTNQSQIQNNNGKR